MDKDKQPEYEASSMVPLVKVWCEHLIYKFSKNANRSRWFFIRPEGKWAECVADSFVCCPVCLSKRPEENKPEPHCTVCNTKGCTDCCEECRGYKCHTLACDAPPIPDPHSKESSKKEAQNLCESAESGAGGYILSADDLDHPSLAIGQYVFDMAKELEKSSLQQCPILTPKWYKPGYLEALFKEVEKQKTNP